MVWLLLLFLFHLVVNISLSNLVEEVFIQPCYLEEDTSQDIQTMPVGGPSIPDPSASSRQQLRGIDAALPSLWRHLQAALRATRRGCFTSW